MDDPFLKLAVGITGLKGPLHTPANPPQEGKVQPVGSIEEPAQIHGEQKPSSGSTGRETNMWGDGDKLPAIPGGLVGSKVGPRPSKKVQEAMAKGFKDEFKGLSSKKK